jgi:cysteine desulfurase / selenocysteine lyase
VKNPGRILENGRNILKTMVVSKNVCPDWDAVRYLFPVTEKYIYLNNAAIAPIALNVKQQIVKCLENYTCSGIVCNKEYLDLVGETRKLSARLINSKPSEITFVKNTTQGILIAANGIRWRKGDNVLIPENEFPANVFPWLNLSKRGVETRFIPVKDGKFGTEDFMPYIDKRTRALSVSAVSYANGFRCNLEDIGSLCRENEIFFVVDAIQALGAIDLDVKKVGIDLLAADAHKWLLGPQGLGISYISEFFLEELDVENLGYKSMINEDEYRNHIIRLKSDASRFEEGTLNIMGIVGLKASLEMLLAIGIPAIEDRLLELNDVLINNLKERNYTITSPSERDERSGILSFFHDKIPTAAIHNDLIKATVVCAQRDGAIRVSPHYYNNHQDLRGFLNALPWCRMKNYYLPLNQR